MSFVTKKVHVNGLDLQLRDVGTKPPALVFLHYWGGTGRTGDLGTSLKAAFDAAIDIYTTDGPSGCFVLCTAPAEAMTNPVCRTILGQALEAIDAFFLKRLSSNRGG
jgi:hypothetical protein